MPRKLGGALAVAVLIVACSHDGTGPVSLPKTTGLTSCQPGTAILTTPPIALSDVVGWVPLGNLNPPGHTFPTDHQYLYHTNPDQSGAATRIVDLVSPGNVTVTGARRTAYSVGANVDYSIAFSACAQVAGEFGHVASIAPSLLAGLGAFDQGCNTYSPNPGLTVTSCYTRSASIAVSAAEPLGTVGGTPGVFALDFSLWDSRVAPIRYANATRWIANESGFDNFHVVGASDYFAEPARSQIATKVGSFDGRARRTAMPLGGTIEIDVPGTAQGMWLNPSQPTHPETPHLAIGPNNVDPLAIDISMGMSQPGFNAGQYRVVPAASGAVNRHPSQITADGLIYCYQPSYGGVVLLQLVDASTLRVEGRAETATCASAQPWAFRTGASFDYRR
jgi:hypothetical protein